MAAPNDEPRPWHRELVEASPVPVAVYDADLVLRYVNGAAVEFVNAADREAVVGRSAAEFVHPDDHDRIARRAERVVEDRETVSSMELRFVAVDGEHKHAVVAGAPVSYEGEVAGQAVLNDVTERKRRERQLRRERDRFELLFEHLPSPVVHGTAEGGEPIVERVNRRFEEVFGYDRAEIEGDNLDEYVVPEGKREEAERLNRRILSEGRVRTEVRRETADGPREFLLHVVMREPDDGPPEGYAIYTDITEQRRTERELERQNERLEEFASVVAHDLRNPLNVAMMTAETIRERDGGDDVDRIVDAHERMAAIIDDLLTLARQGGTIDDPEPVDVAAVAERAWGTVDTANAELRIDGGRRVLADEGRLRELFENLLGNAVEHGSTSSDASRHEGVTVEVGTLDGGFYVADDGPGIPPEERDRVFESGYTTDEEGTGFGLAIVRRIAEAHGWEVGVTDSDDGGARFEVVGVDRPA